jgi:hypothetical protein
MTAAEVIAIALTRDLNPENIKASDIALAAVMYADGYTEDDPYYNEVVAYGVIVNIWERLSTEITDRGVVAMISQGATRPDWETSQKAKQEYVRTLEQYIGLLTEEEPAGVSILVEATPGGSAL